MKALHEQKFKVGKHQSTVVSDTKINNTNFPTPPNLRESGDDEIEYYGGYLVCESVGNVQLSNVLRLGGRFNAAKPLLYAGAVI